MLKTSLYFLAVAFVCLVFADIEITSIDPYLELGRMARGAVTPDFAALLDFRTALLNTLVFALCGVSLAVPGGSILARFFHLAPVRLFCAFIRAVHEIFWAFLFLPVVGLNPVCGVLAIAVPYSGVFAKVYSEIVQEADMRPLQGIPPNAGTLSRFLYGILPVTFADLRNYTSYRFECALRSSAVLGFIGLPTLGFHLETAFREGLYSEASAILVAFYVLIASLKRWFRPEWLPFYAAGAFAFLPFGTSWSWENVLRFFTYEILPWPLRREGALDGSGDVSFSFSGLSDWTLEVFQDELLPGVLGTTILTQVALVGTAVLAMASFPFVCRHFARPYFRRLSGYLLIVIRTTPEYILAYILIQIWGPSMLPAILALALHNGSILAFLSGQNADLLRLRGDGPRRRLDRYFYEVLPQVYGQLLAFLFLRWEVMMRESAIFGILGVYTLGFFIDSAISDDKMDKAILLIFATAVLNMGIDTISQRVRRRLRISVKMTAR